MVGLELSLARWKEGGQVWKSILGEEAGYFLGAEEGRGFWGKRGQAGLGMCVRMGGSGESLAADVGWGPRGEH